MKHRIIIVTTIFLVGLSLAATALADGNFGLDTAAGKANYAVGQGNNIYSLVALGINAFLSLLAIVFFVLVMISGIRWMTARGNEEIVNKSKGTIEAAVVGLVIVLAAYALTNFVVSRLNL